MNGATPEPPRTINALTNSNSRMIGVSHHFLLWRTKSKSSAPNPVGFSVACSEKIFSFFFRSVNVVGSNVQQAGIRRGFSNSLMQSDRIDASRDRNGKDGESNRSASTQYSRRLPE